MLPLHKKIDVAPDAVAIYEKLKALPFGFVLDSAMHVEGLTRYSFVSASPFLVFRSRGDNLQLLRPDIERSGEYVTESRRDSPFEYLKKLLFKYKIPEYQKSFPLVGGAVGYFAYDLGRQIEKMPESAADDVNLPDCCLGFYDLVVAVDHEAGDVHIVSTGLPGTGRQTQTRAEERLRYLEEILLGTNISDKIAGTIDAAISVPTGGGRRARGSVKDWGTGREDYYTLMEKTPNDLLHTDFNRDGYCAVVEKAREYIAAGDIFQVNISQRFFLPAREDPWQVYKKLRAINPAPMAAFLDFGDPVVVSASPERFLSVHGDLIETRPIKGTRPRGGDPVEDQRWRNELWNSAKDRAELVMIVDLERNDLGRVCQAGSVKVSELYRIEEYATVFHLVSTVVGELEQGKDLVDLLLATFPGGSITGAPKIRAMEIIEELEPVRRGIYCGSIGYLGFDGDADLNIVIRTLVFTGGKIYFQVGGGITIDSDPEAEYLETLDKARALVRALGLEEGVSG